MRLPIQVVRERDFKLIARHSLDISEAGLLAVADERVLTGEQVIVCFRSPLSRAWIDAGATVARVLHGRRLFEGGRRSLGIFFDHMEPSMRSRLQRELGFFRSIEKTRR